MTLKKSNMPNASNMSKMRGDDDGGQHNSTDVSLLKPGLYIVPTPIGNLKDITLRALNVLKSVDMIACEDTRTSRKLLSFYGIGTKLVSYHEHNGEKMRPQILKWITEGKTVALISDAGTPLISDPGFKLVRALHESKMYLTSLPGASSVMTALTLSGLPTDHFVFAGFSQAKNFKTLAPIPYTLIFFSTAHKLIDDLDRMTVPFSGRSVVVIREISKMYEEVKQGSFEEIKMYYTENPPRGEIVLLLSPLSDKKEIDWDSIDADIQSLSKTTSAKDLSDSLAQSYGLSKREVYNRILSLKKDKG